MKTRSINRISLTLILFAMFGCILSFLIQFLPFSLTVKIGLSLIFAVFAYLLMIPNCIRYKGITNVVFIMICLSIFFYFGQHLVAIFDPNYLLKEQSHSILDGILDDESIIQATFMIINCMLLLTAGFLAKNEMYRYSDIQSASFEYDTDTLNKKLKSLKYVSLLFVVISIYPTIKYLLAQYALTQSYGYLGRRWLEDDANYYQLLGVRPVEIMISNFFLPAVYGLLISSKTKKGRNVAYLLAGLYIVLYLFTGSRYNILKIIVSLFLIQVIWVKPLVKKDIKKYILIGVIMIGVLSVVSVARNVSTGMDWGNALSDELGMSPTLWESGITFTSVSNVIDKCPSQVDFFYGKSWVGGILQCLPSFLRFGFFDKYTIVTSSTFSHLYYNTTNFGYGSSFIAEGYYNFGYLLYPIVFFFGMFLGWINDKLKQVRLGESPFLFLVLAYVCGEIAYGIRNDLSSVIRICLTSVVIVAITAAIFDNVKRNSR